MEETIEKLIVEMGDNPKRAGLKKTPSRYLKALKHLTSGYKLSLDEVIGTALFPSNASEMVVIRDIELYSLCEHHLLPFFGKCHVGYLPNGKIIGISKIARIVDLFAKRLQVQENLTMQIADAIFEATGAHGVGVIIEAKHLCMMMRGVEKQNSEMSTSCLRGTFSTSSETRHEFLHLVKR